MEKNRLPISFFQEGSTSSKILKPSKFVKYSRKNSKEWSKEEQESKSISTIRNSAKLFQKKINTDTELNSYIAKYKNPQDKQCNYDSMYLNSLPQSFKEKILNDYT